MRWSGHQREFLFVLEGRAITGIATRADVQKQAVKMVTFSFILAAEAGLNQLLEEAYERETWLDGASRCHCTSTC